MLKSIIKFARVRIIATCFAVVFLGSAAAGEINYKTILAFFLIVAFTVHANSINDYSDKEIDKINLKDAHDRPLVTKDITATQFWIIHYGSGILALLLSLYFGFAVLLLTLAVLLIDYAYSLKPLRLTDKTLVSPLLLSITYTYYSFSIGWFAVTTFKPYPWLLATGISVGFMARLLLKDFRDLKGDKKHGKITFLIRYGTAVTTACSAVLWIVAMLIIIIYVNYSLAILITLAIGSAMVCFWLFQLNRFKTIHQQQKLIEAIARAANYALIAILAYLICNNVTNLSNIQSGFIVLSTGAVLLVFNWINYYFIESDNVESN